MLLQVSCNGNRQSYTMFVYLKRQIYLTFSTEVQKKKKKKKIKIKIKKIKKKQANDVSEKILKISPVSNIS